MDVLPRRRKNYEVANDPTKVPGATLVVFKSSYPGIGGSTWADYLSNHTRGIHMNIENEKHKVRESDALEISNKDPEEIKLPQLCRSRSDSTSSSNSRGTKRTRLADEDPNDLLPVENSYDGVKALRSELEEFLYKDSNKISRTSIKFIMSKWSDLENRLIVSEFENQKLKGKLEEKENYEEKQLAVTKSTCPTSRIPSASYAEAAGAVLSLFLGPPPLSGVLPLVVLIKPEKEDDSRNNDEIKDNMCKLLSKHKNDIKVKNLRRMRNKGIVVELDSEKDMQLIKKVDWQKIGLRAENPKKLGPTIIIYDVDKNLAKSDIIEQLWSKNLNSLIVDKEKIKDQIVFRFNIASKSKDRINWILEVPI